ncbi:MAG: zinc-dependent peptidase [Planctomycetota bacterium]
MLTWLLGKGDERFDPAWEEVLARQVWQYRFLDQGQRARVREVVAALVARKAWTGGGGFRVTDVMRVTVSGVSALMTLGLEEPFFFPKLRSFILYPTGYDDPARGSVAGLLPTQDPLVSSPRLGEAWQGGPVVLSWRAAERQARVRGRGRNLVLHEMAHHVDSYDGDMGGTPYFDQREDRRRWREVTDAEYHRLVGQAKRRELTLLDHYGATNKAEFFAVATECFFERPHALRRRHAELFDLLAKFYRQDPTRWAPPPAPDTTPHATPQPKRPPRRSAGFPDLSHLQLGGADELFAHGVLMLGREEFADAERVFTEVLARVPDDGEARQHRGEARLGRGDYAGAIEDAQAALALDPHDEAAMLTHADASLATEDDATAASLVAALLTRNREHAEAWFLRGQIDWRAGDALAAAAAFRRVIDRDPFDADAHLWLADCLDEVEDPRGAEHHRQRAHQLDPDLETDGRRRP